MRVGALLKCVLMYSTAILWRQWIWPPCTRKHVCINHIPRLSNAGHSRIHTFGMYVHEYPRMEFKAVYISWNLKNQLLCISIHTIYLLRIVCSTQIYIYINIQYLQVGVLIRIQLFTSDNVKTICNLGKYLPNSSSLRSSLLLK
jgi:hypothetical protein